ncbi:host cell division inhibitory peptide Kil [Escherichia coli]|nr:host cell division inhibitory peptide Kil [Escherichia coli]
MAIQTKFTIAALLAMKRCFVRPSEAYRKWRSK